MIVLDTDHFSELLREGSRNAATLASALRSSNEEITTTIITAEEQFRGWLALIRRQQDVQRQIPHYESLTRAVRFVGKWNLLEWDDAAVRQFRSLQSLRPKIGTMDLKIASIVLAHDALLLTRNLRDFQRVPNLRVENWLD